MAGGDRPDLLAEAVMNETVKGRSRRRAGRIVVGVDGSPSSIAALRWAAQEARATGARLLVVHAWTYPPLYEVDPIVAREVAETSARHGLEQTMRAALGDDYDDIDVQTDIEHGHPARVLVSRGANARLIVIGAGGHGRLAGLLLGSVGLHLVSHAPAPVVVVPQPPEEAKVATDSVGDELVGSYHPFVVA
jgi:nucleotide-binding universal stress UspA family protein